MKATSPHVTALIYQLHVWGSSPEELAEALDYKAILSEIGEANEPAAIVDVLPFLLSRPDVARVAAATVHKLHLGVKGKDFTSLDFTLRQRSPYSGQYLYEWYKVSPERLADLESFGDASVSVLGLASSHWNGYVRQAAIERLSRIATGAAVPFLILRLNDWVPNVREAAERAIRARIEPAYGRVFVENLPLLSWLKEGRRVDHTPVIDSIHRLLLSKECRTLLFESLRAADRFVRRESFRVALQSERPELEEIVKLGLADGDSVIRMIAAKRVSAAFAGPALISFVNTIKHHPSMPVRREALRILIKLNVSNVIEELQNALIDSHASMREEACYQLQKIGAIDIAAFYREHLIAAEPRTLLAAISGVGETGRADDDRSILPYASHVQSKIRRAAIKALAKLNAKAHVDTFREALKDPSSRVSLEALKALDRQTALLNARDVWEIFSSATPQHVKRNALSLLEKFTKWESIAYLVRGLCETDEEFAAQSRGGVDRWLYRMNRGYSTPSSEQLARFHDALQACGHLLDEPTQQLLRFSTKGLAANER